MGWLPLYLPAPLALATPSRWALERVPRGAGGGLISAVPD
jgi:hypothetical protein